MKECFLSVKTVNLSTYFYSKKSPKNSVLRGNSSRCLDSSHQCPHSACARTELARAKDYYGLFFWQEVPLVFSKESRSALQSLAACSFCRPGLKINTALRSSPAVSAGGVHTQREAAATEDEMFTLQQTLLRRGK